MIKKKVLLGLLIFTAAFSIQEGKAQEVLTLDEAVGLGLENNFGILIAQNQAQIDAVNRTLGNAGFLPTLEISSSYLETIEEERVSIDGVSQGRESIDTDLISVDLALDWTLFDGFRMFTNYNRLTELRNLGETEARLQIDNTVSEIIQTYYEIVRQKKLLGVLENSVDVSEERLRIAETKQELGSGSEYEMLLAQADLNSDRAAVIRQEVVISDTKFHLRELLNMDSDTDFSVEEDIDLGEELNFDDIFSQFAENNPQLQAADIQARIAQLEVNEIRGERLPELELNLGYGSYREHEVVDQVLLEEFVGFRVGLTARLNLFDGFNTNRRSQVAQINRRNSELLFEESFKALETMLRSEYVNYTSTRRLIELENENLSLAGEALEIAIERFRLATITSIELRETQNILFDTEDRLITAQFEAKMAETELLRIGGILLRELVF